MRKIILSVMAVAAVTFTSCGNQAGNGGDADSTANEMEVNVLPDWTDAESAVKSLDASLEIGTPEDVEDCVEKMEVQVAKLVEQGKLDEAKTYAEKIQNFVKENKDKLTATGSTLISSFVSSAEKLDLNNLEASAKDWASTVKAVAGESGAKAISDVEGAAKDAAQGVAGEAAKKVEGAVNKANEAKAKVDEVKNKVDAAKSKVDEVKNKVDEVKSKIDNAPKSAKEAAQQAADKAKQDARSKANDAVSKGLDKVFGK
ncbi:MAG: hypothetical protein MJZ29_06360 [Bacteroidaceae bacterium]|nr:hypothetical protein [Bacteroidaceae bacterium]